MTSMSACSTSWPCRPLGVYGIVLAGWASNSKYSLLGGLRASAQMISYELSAGLAIVSVFMLSGTLSHE